MTKQHTESKRFVVRVTWGGGWIVKNVIASLCLLLFCNIHTEWPSVVRT